MRKQRWCFGTWWFVGVSLLCLACAAATVSAADWVLLIDNTGTMRYGDRGEMTVRGVREFVSLTEPGDRVSVLSYGEKAVFELHDSPVTIEDEADRSRVAEELTFAFNADRTDITAGLETVWEERRSLLPSAGDGRPGTAVVVLLTDGKLIPVYRDYSRYEAIYSASRKRLLELVSLCADEGIKICTIALGKETKVDGELMEHVASTTGGTSHHVRAADDVVDVFRTIQLEQRPDVPVERDEAVATKQGSGWLSSIQDAANAEEEVLTPDDSDGRVGTVSRGASTALSAFPSDFCLASAGVLAVFVGLAAVGMEKRQKWVGKLPRAMFGKEETRVRGYLKPIDAPGTTSARANIGLENPGVGSVKIGSGTPILPRVEATVRFIGTTDRTAPVMVVETGRVTVEGERTAKRKLKDGDILDIDGMRYQYLRGNRR